MESATIGKAAGQIWAYLQAHGTVSHNQRSGHDASRSLGIVRGRHHCKASGAERKSRLKRPKRGLTSPSLPTAPRSNVAGSTSASAKHTRRLMHCISTCCGFAAYGRMRRLTDDPRARPPRTSRRSPARRPRSKVDIRARASSVEEIMDVVFSTSIHSVSPRFLARPIKIHGNAESEMVENFLRRISSRTWRTDRGAHEGRPASIRACAGRVAGSGGGAHRIVFRIAKGIREEIGAIFPEQAVNVQTPDELKSAPVM